MRLRKGVLPRRRHCATHTVRRSAAPGCQYITPRVAERQRDGGEQGRTEVSPVGIIDTCHFCKLLHECKVRLSHLSSPCQSFSWQCRCRALEPAPRTTFSVFPISIVSIEELHKTLGCTHFQLAGDGNWIMMRMGRRRQRCGVDIGMCSTAVGASYYFTIGHRNRVISEPVIQCGPAGLRWGPRNEEGAGLTAPSPM